MIRTRGTRTGPVQFTATISTDLLLDWEYFKAHEKNLMEEKLLPSEIIEKSFQMVTDRDGARRQPYPPSSSSFFPSIFVYQSTRRIIMEFLIGLARGIESKSPAQS